MKSTAWPPWKGSKTTMPTKKKDSAEKVGSSKSKSSTGTLVKPGAAKPKDRAKESTGPNEATVMTSEKEKSPVKLSASPSPGEKKRKADSTIPSGLDDDESPQKRGYLSDDAGVACADDGLDRCWEALKSMTATECEETEVAYAYGCEAVHHHHGPKGWAAILGGGTVGMFDTKEEAIKRAVCAAMVMDEFEETGLKRTLHPLPVIKTKKTKDTRDDQDAAGGVAKKFKARDAKGNIRHCEMSNVHTKAVLKVFRNITQAERVSGAKGSHIGVACRKGGGVVGDNFFRFVYLSPKEAKQLRNKDAACDHDEEDCDDVSVDATPHSDDEAAGDRSAGCRANTAPLGDKEHKEPRPPLRSDWNGHNVANEMKKKDLLVPRLVESPVEDRVSSSTDGLQQLSQHGTESFCIICQTKGATVVFEPCQHCVLCQDCEKAFCGRFCPSCRCPIESRLQPSFTHYVRPRIYSAYSFM